jgi:zinc transporter ZupT
MAIIIEEEKRKINWFAVALIFSLVIIIGAAIYYLFFASIPLVEKVVPPRLQSLQELSSIKLQPETIISDSRFQILKQYVNPIEIQTNSIGKTNPFLR